MKNIFEAMGEILPEAIGAAAVLIGLGSALTLLHLFGDTLIGYFM